MWKVLSLGEDDVPNLLLANEARRSVELQHASVSCLGDETWMELFLIADFGVLLFPTTVLLFSFAMILSCGDGFFFSEDLIPSFALLLSNFVRFRAEATFP